MAMLEVLFSTGHDLSTNLHLCGYELKDTIYFFFIRDGRLISDARVLLETRDDAIMLNNLSWAVNHNKERKRCVTLSPEVPENFYPKLSRSCSLLPYNNADKQLLETLQHMIQEQFPMHRVKTEARIEALNLVNNLRYADAEALCKSVGISFTEIIQIKFRY